MKRLAGFSLVELLVVVAIIGVLVTIAIPRFYAAMARSRQAEAKANLGIIRKLQEAYSMHQISLGVAANASYSAEDLGGVGECGAGETDNALGFRLTDCNKARYLYTTGTTTTGGGTATSGSATGKLVYPGCAESDVWQIAQDSAALTNNTDVVAACDD